MLFLKKNVCVHSANFGKKLTYEYGTLQSSVSSYEMNTMAMKLNKLNPTEIEKTKTDVAALGTRITSLENSSGGTSTVIAEIRADVNAVKEKTEGISRAEDVTNIDAVKTNSLEVGGVVNGVLKDKDGFTYLKVIKGVPKTVTSGYTNVNVLVYNNNRCVVTGIFTETRDKDIQAFKMSENFTKSLPCVLDSLTSIALHDISIGGVKFLISLAKEQSDLLMDITYRNITSENQNTIGTKVYFIIEGIKTDYSDIII